VSKRGRPLFLDSELDDKVITSLKAIRSASGIINKPITLATHNDIAKHYNRNLLSEFDIPIDVWDIAHTEGHWSSNKSMPRYVEQILVQYLIGCCGHSTQPQNKKTFFSMAGKTRGYHKSHRKQLKKSIQVSEFNNFKCLVWCVVL